MRNACPLAGKYQKHVKAEFKIAEQALADRSGLLEWSTADYQCFTWKEKDACIVFYPHKTSAGNVHVRVRDQGSKDKKLAIRLMDLLNEAAGYNCTFTRKND